MFHLHSSKKTIFFFTFLRTTGLRDVRCTDDCFILISCGCNHFSSTPHGRFVHEKENEDEGEISQEAEKEMAMSTDQNSLSIRSCSLYSTCTACNGEKLDLHKAVIMMMGCTSGYTSTQKGGRHLKMLQ